MSFDALNEGTRFKSIVYLVQNITHRKTLVADADTINATNANGRFATSNRIKTDFKPKDPRRKDGKVQDQSKSAIRKDPATSLEGSFGKEKEHYHLSRVSS